MSRTLRERLADNGYESNESFEYPLRCLLSYEPDVIRTLNVAGDPGRHKTAFATALAHSLDYSHVLYHDFIQENDPPPPVLRAPSKDEEGREEPPVDAFDRIMSDVCALSEADRTIVILDQLQGADFREHIRIYKLIKTTAWAYRDAQFQANRNNLLVFLISEEPLYHSLQKASFRVWVSAASLGRTHYRPADFGLGEEAETLMNRLGDLFVQLGVQPTRSEYARLLHDLQSNIHTAEQLCLSLYGWTEGIEREMLHSPGAQKFIDELMPAIEHFVGVDQVEITAPADASPGNGPLP